MCINPQNVHCLLQFELFQEINEPFFLMKLYICDQIWHNSTVGMNGLGAKCNKPVVASPEVWTLRDVGHKINLKDHEMIPTHVTQNGAYFRLFLKLKTLLFTQVVPLLYWELQ